MTDTAQIADFIERTSFDQLPEDVVEELKKRILDSLGIAIGAMGHEPVEIVRRTVNELDRDGPCRLWGTNVTASPPDAAMVNGSLVRYLNYVDAFLTPDETPHPSDSVGAAIAAAEYVDASGADLLTAIGIAYEIHGALGWNAPTRDTGWDHPHVVFASAAAVSKCWRLTRDEIRNAIGIAGAAYNPIRVTKTGMISMWMGSATPNLGRNAVYSALLAKNGMEGPTDVFEGKCGWKEMISGEFEVEFTNCERVTDIMTKRYMAGTHAQPAIEGIIELVERDAIDPDSIEAITVETYDGAKHVMGGGESDSYDIRTREMADHSLPYTLAVGVLDGTVSVNQYHPDRIQAEDVQSLLRTVTVEAAPDMTERYRSGEQPCRLEIQTTTDTFHIEKSDFIGHPNRPMSWDVLIEKFYEVTGDIYPDARKEEIIETTRTLETRHVTDLIDLLDEPE